MFDMSIISGDIRDQNRKLSEIAPKFGRFLALQIFGGGLSKSCTRVIIPTSRHVVWKSFVRILPLARKLLNFKPNFKFSGLIFFWGGGLRPSLGVR